jgi:hypothetical protein
MMQKVTTILCVFLDIGASVSARPERTAMGFTSSRRPWHRDQRRTPQTAGRA